MGAKLPDLETLWKAGINPKTGLPIKLGGYKCTINLRYFLISSLIVHL